VEILGRLVELQVALFRGIGSYKFSRIQKRTDSPFASSQSLGLFITSFYKLCGSALGGMPCNQLCGWRFGEIVFAASSVYQTSQRTAILYVI
jgi:hypothetical protein